MLGRKIVIGHLRQQLADHVLAEFLGAGVRIVVRAVPIDRLVFGDHFILPLARHRHGAHMAEAAQAVIVVRAHGQLYNLQRAAQIHVQTALLRLAIQRSRAVNHRVGGVHQAIVVILRQPELRRGQIAAKNSHPRLQVFIEAREVQVQLQRLPQTHLGFVSIARPDQQVQRSAVPFQQIGGDMRADVSGRTGQEYRHVAPFVPVLTVSPCRPLRASWKWRGGRASSGRPSIRGYVHRRSAGM